MIQTRNCVPAAVALLLAGCSGSDGVPESRTDAKADVAVFEGPVARADCGPGSQPENDVQGRVTLEDRESGRSKQGYRCNLELVGQYQGEGTTWVSASYDRCAYHAQTASAALGPTPGVNVVDVSDPAHPRLSKRLTSPAFLLGTWETLKVNEARGLLAGVAAQYSAGAVFFDVYDIKADCANPQLLNGITGTQLTIPANLLGHEGQWSPDGKTYWASSAYAGFLTAIDVSNPALPRIITTANTSVVNHGFELSEDGNRLYIAQDGTTMIQPNGLIILDVSDIQARKPLPQIRRLGSVFWEDGAGGQHSVPVSWNGRPHLIFVDEKDAGAARIIDISDEMAPRVISKLKLEIHMPEFAPIRASDTSYAGAFGYDAHYCAPDRREDPTALACGYFQSGVRVFDIRDPGSPREIAYYNPPAQADHKARLTGSEHASSPLEILSTLSADLCSSPPRFVEQPDGERQLWVTCQDNGFMVLKFSNGVYPISGAAVADTAGRRFGGACGYLSMLFLLTFAFARRANSMRPA